MKTLLPTIFCALAFIATNARCDDSEKIKEDPPKPELKATIEAPEALREDELNKVGAAKLVIKNISKKPIRICTKLAGMCQCTATMTGQRYFLSPDASGKTKFKDSDFVTLQPDEKTEIPIYVGGIASYGAASVSVVFSIEPYFAEKHNTWWGEAATETVTIKILPMKKDK